MSEEPEVAIIGCATANEPPRVPSTHMRCVKCGNRVWVSDTLLTDLADRGVEPDNIHPMCLYTCVVLPDDVQHDVTEGQRRELHARGFSDEQIDEMIELANQLVQRGE